MTIIRLVILNNQIYSSSRYLSLPAWHNYFSKPSLTINTSIPCCITTTAILTIKTTFIWLLVLIKVHFLLHLLICMSNLIPWYFQLLNIWIPPRMNGYLIWLNSPMLRGSSRSNRNHHWSWISAGSTSTNHASQIPALFLQLITCLLFNTKDGSTLYRLSVAML